MRGPRATKYCFRKSSEAAEATLRLRWIGLHRAKPTRCDLSTDRRAGPPKKSETSVGAGPKRRLGYVRMKLNSHPRCAGVGRRLQTNAVSVSRLSLGFAITLALITMSTVAQPSASYAAGDANAATCPNEAAEGLRAYLPDCRAYEMVSPPFKGGFGIESTASITASGDSLLSTSAGAFAGTETDILGSYYQFVRGSQGWATAAISPPAARFPANELLAAAPTLGETLWAARLPTQALAAKDLYLRERDGNFVKVGPMGPPAAEAGAPGEGSTALNVEDQLAGAANDLSRVFFKVNHVFGVSLWPGDTTDEEGVPEGEGGLSLYEYRGVGNQRPSLVGVDAKGNLISDCRTSLGSDSSGDAYNAVSTDGERVFFTARGHSEPECLAASAPSFNELYARLNGTETVPISEPTRRQCIECDTEFRASAEFQGASEDGSKVFFLTEQELLPGDATRTLYEYDFENAAGEKITRVSAGSATPEVEGVARVSEDGSHVYFVAKAALTGANAEGDEPVSGENNFYVLERDASHRAGKVAFIGRLEPGDEGDWSGRDLRAVQATPNGQLLVFVSSADLTGGEDSTQSQVFEYDAQTEQLVRISVGQSGFSRGSSEADEHAASIPEPAYSGTADPSAATIGDAVSVNGATVVFTTSGALTPNAEAAAAAGAASVYEYRSVGNIANGNVYLVSDGTNSLDATLTGMDPEGSDIFFETADPLSGADGDTAYDIYDARVDGGFAPRSARSPTEQEPSSAGAAGAALGGLPATAQGVEPATAPLAQPIPGRVTRTTTRKALTEAEALARALKACRRDRRVPTRNRCEAAARRKYSARAKHARGKK
jgi:hypothetical protein